MKTQKAQFLRQPGQVGIIVQLSQKLYFRTIARLIETRFFPQDLSQAGIIIAIAQRMSLQGMFRRSQGFFKMRFQTSLPERLH